MLKTETVSSNELIHIISKRPARLQPASCQKTCPMGRAESEGLRPLPFITRSARLNKSGLETVSSM